MMCGMCESHINDAVRNAFPVKKGHVLAQPKSANGHSLRNGDPEAELRPVIAKTGYELTSYVCAV